VRPGQREQTTFFCAARSTRRGARTAKQDQSMPIDFKPGQIWTFKSRPHEPDAFICVLAVDTNDKLGQVVSIAIARVKIPNVNLDGGIQESLPHAPITAAVLSEAVLDCVATDGPRADDPSIEDAYRQWREPYDKGEAGVFTISPADILDIIEGTLSTEDPPRA
jgi:hypothetical protein